MSLFKLKDKLTGPVALTATGLFLCAAVIYFLPVDIAHKIAVPAVILTAASLWLCPPEMTLALLFCALGDYMGSCDNFIGQMGFFAAGHVCFIAYFIKRYRTKVEHDRKLTGKAKGYMGMVIFCAICLTVISFFRIVPEAGTAIIKAGTAIYTCIICAMMVIALLQRSSLFALGAVLFVFSDFILAWNMFVEPVPGSRFLIMIPYYSALWLLYIRSTSFRVGPEMRLMRF